jgi:hypothetical protein
MLFISPNAGDSESVCDVMKLRTETKLKASDANRGQHNAA